MEIISHVIIHSINSYSSLLYGSLVLYLDHGDKVTGSNPLPSKLFTIFFAIDKSFDGFIFLNGDVILSHYLSHRFRRKYLHVIIHLISLLNDGKWPRPLIVCPSRADWLCTRHCLKIWRWSPAKFQVDNEDHVLYNSIINWHHTSIRELDRKRCEARRWHRTRWTNGEEGDWSGGDRGGGPGPGTRTARRRGRHRKVIGVAGSTTKTWRIRWKPGNRPTQMGMRNGITEKLAASKLHVGWQKPRNHNASCYRNPADGSSGSEPTAYAYLKPTMGTSDGIHKNSSREMKDAGWSSYTIQRLPPSAPVIRVASIANGYYDKWMFDIPAGSFSLYGLHCWLSLNWIPKILSTFTSHLTCLTFPLTFMESSR